MCVHGTYPFMSEGIRSLRNRVMNNHDKVPNYHMGGKSETYILSHIVLAGSSVQGHPPHGVRHPSLETHSK